MSFSVVPSGKITYVREALAEGNGLSAVRVLVRLEAYDASKDQAICSDACYPLDKVLVDTTLLSPFHMALNGLYSVIGDLDSRRGVRLIKLRTITSMEGIDLEMYKKALEMRRRFLGEKYKTVECKPVEFLAEPSQHRPVVVLDLDDDEDEEIL